MHRSPLLRTPSPSRRPLPRALASLTLPLALYATGCLSPALHQRSAALAAATAPVVEQAAQAYRSANDLYALRVDYDAVDYFDLPPTYNPLDTRPLLSDMDIDRRLAVLEAFRCYVRSIVAITSGASSTAVEASSQSLGGSLTRLGNDLAPSVEATFGLVVPPGSAVQTTVAITTGNTVTTKTSTRNAPPPDPITPGIRNGISTATAALGKFLIDRKIKRELPGKIKDMDLSVQTLCTLLEGDLDVLQYEEHIDSDSIIDRETLFARATKDLTHEQRRAHVMTLPGIVRRRRNTDQQLAELRLALIKLADAHRALAAAAIPNHPESLKAKLDDLAAAASGLGTFYSSLPAK